MEWVIVGASGRPNTRPLVPTMLKVRCQAHATLDDKGRLALPSPLRVALTAAKVDRLVLVFSQGAVWGWDEATFSARVEGPMMEADPFAPDVLAFSHALLATAQDADLDAQGRIRVPPLLRELAGIDREVVVNSLLDRVEIWDKARWEEHFQESIGRAGQLQGMPGRKP
jgi:MraZ protein